MLLGSGLSRAARVPNVMELTTCLMKDAVSVGTMTSDPAPDGADLLFAVLHEIMDSHLRTINLLRSTNTGRNWHRDPNYEDFCYLARQIADNDFGEYENPAAELLHQKVAAAMKACSSRAVSPGLDCSLPAVSMLCDDVFRWTIRRIARYLRCAGALADLSKLDFLIEAARGLGDSLDVFTLNHDTILEDAWVKGGVSFNDGFCPAAVAGPDGPLAPYSEVLIWDPAFYESGELPSLYKLHGSIDWLQYDAPAYPGANLPPAKISGGASEDFDAAHLNGLELRLEPIILAGTFNKMLEYSRGACFTDLFCAFCHGLNEAERLVIVGYGFGDKGINGQIVQWLTDPHHRAAWVDLDHSATFDVARPAAVSLMRFEGQGGLSLMGGGIEQHSWEDVSAALGLA